jgi:hypothetical protein
MKKRKQETLTQAETEQAIRDSWSEAEFMEQIIAIARSHGWRVAHFRAAKVGTRWMTPVHADGKGFPDLFMVRWTTGHRLCAEVKIKGNTKTPEQQQWLSDMELAGIPAYTWYPSRSDWLELNRVLEFGPGSE